MKTFEYFKPATLSEAFEMYGRFGSGAKLLMGGTDLTVMIDDGLVAPDYLIDLKGIKEFKSIEIKEGYVEIGANVTFTELIESPIIREKIPVLWEASRTVASTGVRNRATLVGNICSAVPSADSAPALLVLKALVNAQNNSGTKEVPIEEFFVGPRKTVLSVGDVVTKIRIPVNTGRFGSSYIKMGRYDGEDLAQVGVATFVNETGDVRVAFGAVAPKPVRAYEAEEFLRGKALTEELLDEVIPLAMKSISPISDVRASKEYRLHISGVLLKRSLRASLSRLQGKGPEYGVSLV
ncbi:MAG: FAD binding domain-containing protein [Caldisericaceae bacterium]